MDFKQMLRNVPERKSYSAGSVIFEEGEQAKVMYLVVKGQVSLSIKGEQMSLESPGGLIGVLALIDQAERSASAKAETDCVLAPLDREQFVAMLRETPEFSMHVMSVLAGRLRLANEVLAAI